MFSVVPDTSKEFERINFNLLFKKLSAMLRYLCE